MQLSPYQDRGGYLSRIPLPELYLLRQRFARPRVYAIEAAISSCLDAAPALAQLQPGARIAIAVGSRGVAEIARIVRALVTELRSRDFSPFIIPAMGSHGGATAEGQREILESLGVNEASSGAPVISSLDVDVLGQLENGLQVHIDRAAHAADGIIVVNRIKPHTDFSAPIESGLAKMLAIGLGKHAGALAVHSWGVEGMSRYIPEVARFVVTHASILLGVAIVENAFDEVAEIVAVPPEEIGGAQERELLRRAKAMMARLPWEALDTLVVDQIGKNISGAGMDTNIVGRIRFEHEPKPTVATIGTIAVLDVTEASHGNAVGLGLADCTTRRLMEKIDLQAVYINSLTAGITATNSCKIPMMLETDREAVAAAIRMSGRPDLSQVRLARIENTLRLEYLLASPAALTELRAESDVEVLGPALPFALQPDGSLPSFAATRARYE